MYQHVCGILKFPVPRGPGVRDRLRTLATLCLRQQRPAAFPCLSNVARPSWSCMPCAFWARSEIECTTAVLATKLVVQCRLLPSQWSAPLRRSIQWLDRNGLGMDLVIPSPVVSCEYPTGCKQAKHREFVTIFQARPCPVFPVPTRFPELFSFNCFRSPTLR